MRFDGKVCVVTGGALGIGRCIARAFGKEGARLAIIDKAAGALEESVRELSGMGVQVMGYPGDVAEKRDLEAFADRVISACGKVDCLINNACLSKGGLISRCGYEDFEYVQRVGVIAPYYLTMLFQKAFSSMAAVVNIASTRAFMSQPDTESYSAAKGGIAALTHALAASLMHKVRVNSISPGWIDTGSEHQADYTPDYSVGDRLQHPSGRVGRPEDIARAALFLCDPANDFITGENLTVDGGMSKLMIYHDDLGWSYRPEAYPQCTRDNTPGGV